MSISGWLVRQEIKHAIDQAWGNPEGKELQQQLFPNGKPTPEEFIQTVAEVVKETSKKEK